MTHPKTHSCEIFLRKTQEKKEILRNPARNGFLDPKNKFLQTGICNLGPHRQLHWPQSASSASLASASSASVASVASAASLAKSASSTCQPQGGMVQAWVAKKLVNVTFYEFFRCPIYKYLGDYWLMTRHRKRLL